MERPPAPSGLSSRRRPVDAFRSPPPPVLAGGPGREGIGRVLQGGVLAAAAVWGLSLPPASSGAAEFQDPLAEPFLGVTTDGTPLPDLFPIRATGVSTRPVMEAALAFRGALNPEQRAETVFPIDHIEWRRWHNIHRFDRNGVSFQEMTAMQREAAFALMQAGLSARGFQQTRDVMRLNGELARLRDNFEEYGEFLYHFNLFGEPSATDPWGWQLNGHHLVVNYFVLGDQVVMTPTFVGSEPVVAAADGPYAGAEVLQEEQDLGLALMRSLRSDQQARATLAEAKPGNNALAQAFRDNLVLDHAGLPAREMDAVQKALLLELVGLFVGTMADGHARVRMEEVHDHLEDTWFGWVGSTGEEAVFYYRIHSPVLLIEFDHQVPVALPGERVPGRRHIHAVVRTPNGNDYGRDLLRQHYEARAGDPAHGHRH
jgi:hypothetical protein